MYTLRRLAPYFRPLRTYIVVAVALMALYAVLSGFSLGLILPIIDKVFVHAVDQVSPTLSVGQGLGDTWHDVIEALRQTPGLNAKLDAAKAAAAAGLTRVQQQSAPRDVLIWLCLTTLVVILLKNIAEFGRRAAFFVIEQRSAEAMRNDLFQHILSLPMSTLHRMPSGQLVSRVITDVELVQRFTINTAANFSHNLFQAIVYLLLSIWASPKLAAASFLIVPPIAIITAKLSGKLRKRSSHAQARIADLTDSLTETLGVMRVVKAFGTEPAEVRRFSEHAGAYRRSVIRLLTIDGLAAPLSEFWGVLIGVGVLFIGGQLVLDPGGSLTPGRFFVFLLALLSMLHPLKQLSGVVTAFQRGVAAAERMFEVLDLVPESDPENAIVLNGVGSGVRFDHVTFGYDPERPVLLDVSLDAPAGTTTALVGPSGAGKTTLVDLIPRFYDPDSGTVFVNGIDVRRVSRRSLRALLGAVTQETLLLNDTVARNIAYGSEGASLEQIQAAATAANADEFIRNMPKGYDTMIGERGVLLSGGQRQRLAISRAILRDPEILILDEATSALDTESEQLVQQAIDRLLRGRTTFVIAHRLSTVRRADRILVIDGGRVVESGTHDELMQQSGLYQRLHALQFQTHDTPPVEPLES